jgi:hypothetical protein
MFSINVAGPMLKCLWGVDHLRRSQVEHVLYQRCRPDAQMSMWCRPLAKIAGRTCSLSTLQARCALGCRPLAKIAGRGAHRPQGSQVAGKRPNCCRSPFYCPSAFIWTLINFWHSSPTSEVMAEVSPGSLLSGTPPSYGASTVARTSDRGRVAEV